MPWPIKPELLEQYESKVERCSRPNPASAELACDCRWDEREENADVSQKKLLQEIKNQLVELTDRMDRLENRELRV